MRRAHDRPDEVATIDAYIIGDVRLALGVGVCFGCDQMRQGWGILTQSCSSSLGRSCIVSLVPRLSYLLDVNQWTS